MQVTISPHLLSTYTMIKLAFPNGITPESYLPLLTLLYEEMSDRNLAEVISQYTGKDYAIVLNDLYRVISTDITSLESIDNLKQYLLTYGYQNWLKKY